jgi:hypothetical protein
VIITLAAALAGWAVLALLERLLPRAARRVWTIAAIGVLLVSFAPLMVPAWTPRPGSPSAPSTSRSPLS